MAYCEVGQKDCPHLGQNIDATLDVDERAELMSVDEALCQDGFDVAKSCGEIVACGLVSCDAHFEELQIMDEIDEGGSYAS